MNITQELDIVAASLERLAIALANDGDPVGAQVTEDNAGRLRSLIAEQIEVERQNGDFRQVLLVAREVCGEMTPTVRVVKLRQMIETILYDGSPTPIEASQVGGQLPDGVDAPNTERR